ncbi:MAG TPA: hypothetical protein VKH35_07300 [Thermoanaerobaculia bacterium]|nr:hypothetical protein [Thermoanaerobaculia bacterium]
MALEDEKNERSNAESDAESRRPEAEGQPVQKVTVDPGGAKRDSYFRHRDYPPEE